MTLVQSAREGLVDGVATGLLIGNTVARYAFFTAVGLIPVGILASETGLVGKTQFATADMSIDLSMSPKQAYEMVGELLWYAPFTLVVAMLCGWAYKRLTAD